MNARDQHEKPDSPDETLQQHAERESVGIIREFWQFLRHNRKWWLVPFLLSLALLGLLVVLSNSPLAPFVYPF